MIEKKVLNEIELDWDKPRIPKNFNFEGFKNRYNKHGIKAVKFYKLRQRKGEKQ